jgi:hypothetical protein
MASKPSSDLCRLFLVFFLTAALAGAAPHRDGVGKRTECRRLMGPFLRRAERTTYRLRHDELAGHRWLRSLITQLEKDTDPYELRSLRD